MGKNKNLSLIFLVILLSFTWIGSSYFTWFYRLLETVKDSRFVDILTDIIGYLFQAAGVLLASLLLRRVKPGFITRNAFLLSTGLALFFSVLAVLSRHTAAVIVFGLLMNLCFGLVFYLYLMRLCKDIPDNRRGTVFAAGYGCASIITWLLSLPSDGTFLQNPFILIIYAVIAAASVAVYTVPADRKTAGRLADTFVFPKSLLILTCTVVIFLSLTKNMGGAFPIADLSTLGNIIEFSRLFYAIGLIIAGIVCDKSRKVGAICCAVALFAPFVQLLFLYMNGASIGLWIMDYILFGLFTVYRIVLFTDISRKSPHLLYLAGMGMFYGRLGDAAGTFIGLLLKDNFTTLIICTSVLFVCTTALFFAFYQRMYFPATIESKSSRLIIEEFATEYELSSREISVLTLLLERKTNGEIAESLIISESTVKFHVKNILKKTSCSNRTELIALFNRR